MEAKPNSHNPGKTRHAIFYLLLGLATLLLLYLLKPFFYPLFWAAVRASSARLWVAMSSRA